MSYTIQIMKNGVPQKHTEIPQEYKAFVLWNMLETRAEQKGLDFDLTVSDVRTLLKTKRCYYTGAELMKEHGVDRQNKPTFERIDSSKGYTRGNVKVVSEKANHAKSDLTLRQLKTMVRRIEQHM